MESSPPAAKRRSPRIDAEKKCRAAAKQLANAVSERVWGLAVSPDGEEYYYHLATNATAWSLPAGAILQADGDTYVSEQQHRLSPKVSPKKVSPKAKASPSTRSPKGGSPKARVAATSGSPKSPKSRIDAAAATPPQKLLDAPAKPHVEAGAGEEPPGAAEEKAVEEEEEEAAQAEEAEEHTSVQASRLRTLLASVQEQLQQSERRRAESAEELQVCSRPT